MSLEAQYLREASMKRIYLIMILLFSISAGCSSHKATPTSSSSTPTYTFYVSGNEASINLDYMINGTYTTVWATNCSCGAVTCNYSLPWSYSFSANPGVSYQIQADNLSSNITVSVEKNGTTFNQLSGSLDYSCSSSVPYYSAVLTGVLP